MNLICSAHKRFKTLAPEKVGHNRNSKLPMHKLLTLPELCANPFADRMCLIFSSTKVCVSFSFTIKAFLDRYIRVRLTLNNDNSLYRAMEC